MKALCLNFYIYELQKHYGILLFEWLLEFARKNEIPRGIATKGIAGYSNNLMSEEHFFELASDVPVTVTFILSKEESEKLLSLLKEEKISLFYTISEVESGILSEN